MSNKAILSSFRLHYLFIFGKKPMKKLIAVITTIGLTTASLKSDDAVLKRLQESSHISFLLAKRFLQERAYACKKRISYNQNEKPLSIDDKIFENPSCEIHDMTISAKREECDGQEAIILETKVFGTVDDFEDLDVIEAEKRLLKFTLIKAYKVSLAQHKEKNRKPCVTLILDGSTKVTIQPTFVIIQKGYRYLPGSEETSTDRKGMQLLTVFSKAEFDSLTKQYFDA